MDISVTPNEFMSYYTQQYLLFGQVPIVVEYGRPVGYALNE